MRKEKGAGMSRSAVSDDIRARILPVTHFITDVDGVLTDGRIIMDDEGREIKHFDVRDGHGLKLLMRGGIHVIFLTGRTSRVVLHRAADLGVSEIYQGARDKVSVLEEIMGRHRIGGDRIACMGDDIVDVPLFRRVGFSAAVADASEYAKNSAHYVTGRAGGRGAVREVCELILQVQEKWQDVVARYELDPREGLSFT